MSKHSQTFAELGISSGLVKSLAKRGIKQPFPVQSLVIGDVLSGRDVLCKSPTGSGKTLAFGLGLIDRIASKPGINQSALVLAPTRELVRQIHDELAPLANARKLRIATVYGGVSIPKQIQLSKKAQIIVATPGRLEDLLKRKAFSLNNVRLLVLDEADRMLDMGFRPAIDRITKLCPKKRQTLFFSATLDGEAGKLAAAYTYKATRHEYVDKKKKAAAIEHRFISVNQHSRLERLVDELDSERELALIFVRTKRSADTLVRRLGKNGIKAAAIHGNKSQNNREKTLSTFESGRIDTLVATDVVARGIDIDRISHVINFDPPEDSDTYVHRIGRTGRAGRTGIGITLVTSEQKRHVRRLANRLRLSREFDLAHS
jgi:superfamily II DNA/RNA helicase